MAEVGGIRLADDDASGGLDAAGNGAVEIGDLVFLEDGPAGVVQSLAGFKIFDRNWQAVERTKVPSGHDCGFGGASAIKGEVGVEVEKSVDGRIDGLESGEEGFGQFDWRELFVSNGGDEFGGGCAGKFWRSHGRQAFRVAYVVAGKEFSECKDVATSERRGWIPDRAWQIIWTIGAFRIRLTRQRSAN